MAKMFYTLEEAAEKLGVSEDQVKEMAANGQIQQFRDRDKLMFKREQVDNLGKSGSSGSSISLSDDTDAMGKSADPNEATGVSVFDADEVDAADPAAQTQVTPGSMEDDDLSLESVGSGSGLLDLTRESDDTSLGAELLDEIYPGSSGDTAGESGAAIGSSGVFESAMASGSQAGITGMGQLDVPRQSGPAAQPAATMVSYDDESEDPAVGSAGLLLGATVALVITLIVATAHVVGLYSPVAQTIGSDSNTLMIWTAGLLVGSIVLGLVGMGVSKVMNR